MTTPISVEILLPPGFQGTGTGGQGSGPGTNNMFPGVNAPISIELIHPGFPGTGAGGQGAGTGYIKYSLPKAPGRKSVEIYYPYDFAQGKVLPQLPNIFPFNYPPQTVPQQQPPRHAAPTQGNGQPLIFNNPPQTAPQQPPRTAAPQANNPQQQIQQDRQVPAGQP
ncbi:secretory calcium-binding phosphoprotein 5 isoform X1 [Clarias gariepinus]|uniref:secretory calcium-binding phosphoprotein 5 isoform X1 n=1 Tax=Clarias gariepinus TaxID=13013 RepID=UPI00234CAD1C|nr:secretory calcium-binding phosphoprotein 5 isoform X1 [Clarias gariepinus]